MKDTVDAADEAEDGAAAAAAGCRAVCAARCGAVIGDDVTPVAAASGCSARAAAVVKVPGRGSTRRWEDGGEVDAARAPTWRLPPEAGCSGRCGAPPSLDALWPRALLVSAVWFSAGGRGAAVRDEPPLSIADRRA